MCEELFQLRFTARQLKHQSEKHGREELKEKLNIAQEMKRGNMEAARIHAQSAIAKKTESLNCLRLSARVGGAADRMEQAAQMKSISAAMAKAVKALGLAAKTLDLQRIATTMDSFDKQTEDLGVAAEYVERALFAAAATPAEDVELLLAQVADERGIEVVGQMAVIPSAAVAAAVVGARKMVTS